MTTAKRTSTLIAVVIVLSALGHLGSTISNQNETNFPLSARNFLQMGPIRIFSPLLDSQKSGQDLQDPNDPQTITRSVGWISAASQKQYGNVRVTASWTSTGSKLQLTPSTACRYIFDKFGLRDGLTSAEGLFNLSSMGGGDSCETSANEGHRYRYEFAIADPKCSTRGLVVALVQTSPKDAPNVLTYVRMLPTNQCTNEMRTLSIVPACVLILGSCLGCFLFALVYRKSS